MKCSIRNRPGEEFLLFDVSGTDTPGQEIGPEQLSGMMGALLIGRQDICQVVPMTGPVYFDSETATGGDGVAVTFDIASRVNAADLALVRDAAAFSVIAITEFGSFGTAK